VSYNAFTFGIEDNVGRITLSRPERGNPFDGDFCAELSLIATECDESPEVRSVLIDAQGPYFSVGADLRRFVRDRDELPHFVKNATVGLHSALSRLARMDAPVVIAVHGLAVGGSVSLSAAADFCLAARSAEFYAAYTGIGLIPDGGASYFLPRRLGVRRATEFLMRNQRWSAATAMEYGLVNEVVDDDQLAGRAWALATELAEGPTRAYGEIKNLMLSTWEQPLEAQMEQEARAMSRAARTEDGWHGINAVLAKGKPQFHGR